MKLSGVIRSGTGKGAFFTGLDWVVEQCERMLGYKPFPGTLNVRVQDEDLEKLPLFLSVSDGVLMPDHPGSCGARVKKVWVNDVPAAVIRPDEAVRVHATRVLELIGPRHLRSALGAADGDTVTICGDAQEIKRPTR